ncbi:HAMP domain-containing sensor histidine kinase [Paenibacillus sp. FSL R7-0337]|uniref:sensor histidine kinase n=1 Tax=Paenibacillus sp. FSL R7-0337 TaxID=1926588 RepID=UPI00096DF56A|nr:HAMP domain-containing sensor histidine kinase [Paenibacillus sp. FSL R7-0337]OMF98801.1 two-component sensor histidine kinase [Paenibacillus sp. FSL R7-0337]
MDSAVRILRKFVGSTLLVSTLLLLFNLILLGSLIFKETHQEASPEKVVQEISSALQGSDGEYSLDPKAAALLQLNRAWAMLLDANGKVTWSEQLPPEIPRAYNIVEVAKFSRYYLLEYPVYIWEHPEEGLLVVGYPKYSYEKYQLEYLTDWLRSLPLRVLLLLVCNVVLAVALSLFIGTRLIRSIRPLINSIHALAKDKPVNLETAGIFSDLSESINSASATLQTRNTQLKSRDEARSNWIAGISHDIRTPLSMILGYASNLEEQDNLRGEQKRQAAIIRRQGEQLRSLVSDLNLVSMLEYDMQPLQLKPVRLSALARTVVSDTINNGLEERYSLDLCIMDERLQVMGDEKLLYRAVSNLVQNSIRHNPDGRRITVTVSRSPNPKEPECCLSVSDDGPGVPSELLPELILLPYSGKRTRPVRQGHGLGLPMVARIAEAHKGKLVLESNTGYGLRATLQIPPLA